jgi:hypothetical protein
MLEFAFILHFDGRDEATMEVFKINYVFSYGDTDSIVISHTGLEDVSLVDSEINSGLPYRYNNDSHYYKRQTSSCRSICYYQ